MKTLNEVLSEIESSSMAVYVYILYKPCGEPFYVGKGKNRRLAAHEAEAKESCDSGKSNMMKLNTIRKIWRNGGVVGYGIDSWHESDEAANQREIELIAAIGRRHKNTGPLVNLTAGGEGTSDIPDEIKERISETLKKYFHDNPDALQNLQAKKNEWIENNPEEYAEAQRRRLEICQQPEVREQVAATLKQYYENNPDAREQMSQRAKKYFEDNPEAAENIRRKNLENNNADNIIRWIAENPELLAEKHERHGEFMKEWHSTEEGKAKTKQAAEKRNAKFRTDDHRQHMAEKTRQYALANPEAEKVRREKAKATRAVVVNLRKECLDLLQDRLIDLGLLKEKGKSLSSGQLWKWKAKGKIPSELIPPSGNAKLPEWQAYRAVL